MPEHPLIENDFLVQLLDLQQDGRDAISGPSNWVAGPLLSVDTELDEEVDGLADELCSSREDSTAQWYFLIGSPGNGKSALMGRLYRRLVNSGCSVVTGEDGIPVAELPSDAVPYVLEVYNRDEVFASTLIVQDASVVRQPFAPDVDPATDLITILTRAWERGQSLVLCTNRGVIEKAYGMIHSDQARRDEGWFKAIKFMVDPDRETDQSRILRLENGRRRVHDSVRIRWRYLDQRSLLLKTSVFERLLDAAIDESNWSACNECAARAWCPFRLNRDWLSDQHLRKNVLQILQRAEALTGQVIVFREALALLSLVLAGCPRDYDDKTPCQWVQSRVKANDWFALLSRRLYMSLGSAACPYGMEQSRRLVAQQRRGLASLLESVPDDEGDVHEALSHVVQGKAPSAVVGVERILGPKGALRQLDAVNDQLPPSFTERWDGEYQSLLSCDCVAMSDLERRALKIWARLEQLIEQTTDHHSADTFRALRRWSSNFTLHLGSVSEGVTSMSVELDDFLKILSLLSTPPSERSSDQSRKLMMFEQELNKFMNSAQPSLGVSGEAIRLAENLHLRGDWPTQALKPRPLPNLGSGNISILVTFGINDKDRAFIGADTFVWLHRRATGHLDSRCYPPDLLASAVHAKVRAASKSSYAFEDDGVTLVVGINERESIVLTRYGGDLLDE